MTDRPDLLDNVRRWLARRPHGTDRESRIIAKLIDGRTDEDDVRAALLHLCRDGEISRHIGRGRQSLARRTVYQMETHP